jgi:hypothetical protein
VICATNACTTISFVSSSLIRKLPQVSPVQEVVNPNSKIDEEGELRTDLINLLERSQEHLTPKQSSEVKHLLKEYEGLFAASDSDYGRTNVVKHKIATGSAHPITQPSRRL